MARIFISYRREDCAAHAGRLADTLATKFGEDSVFMDVDTIELGTDFVDRIEEAIGDCDVVLAMIGDDWLTVTDDEGNRRIDDPHDFVRIEIAEALARDHVRVIPVLVEGAEMPTAEVLPEPLVPLARRNGITLTDTRWRSDTGVLIQAVGRAIGSGAPAVAAPQQPAPPAGTGAAAAVAAAVASPQPSFAERYLWLIPALLSLGWAVFVYFGLKAQERRWLILGGLYLLPQIAFLAISESSALSEVALSVWLLSWALSVVHLLAVRPRYLETVGATTSPAGGA